jgi:membrane protein CcdC involved in cytochrome C biogenesis
MPEELLENVLLGQVFSLFLVVEQVFELLGDLFTLL